MLDHSLTRRRLGAVGAGAMLTSLASCAPPTRALPALANRQFPADFAFGAASAAFQTEGSTDADGRGKSIWDAFQDEPGTIIDGSDARVACDSYRRYADDIDLLADAGLKHYRFSIAWPRIVPDGAGALSEAGLDFYARFIDAMLARGVTPFATLYHWDLPLALQAKGGWAKRDTAQHFADYAARVAARLGDRLKTFVVLNEAAVHTVLGHVVGEHAPGLKDASLLGPVIHHLNLGQGLAIAALRAAGAFSVGTTMALQPARPEGAPLAFWNRPAAEGFDELWNGAFLDPLFKGAYPKTAQDLVAPHLQDSDLSRIQQAVDFLGVNYYSPTTIKLDLSSPSRIAAGAPPGAAPRDAFGREIDPSGLLDMLTRVRDDYGNPLVYITENGCSDAFSDGPAVLDDGFRIDYLRTHLAAVKAAMEAGSRVGGFFHWTLIDNWEWALGYRSKFGLVAMDRASGVRAPKASYRWYAQLAATGLLDEANE
ncbi:MAG: GH1 family beta-glucosidase [Parvularculaceae bacterium]|nr:GH1 family beta-glucosidase [Parvularculaceae bacterium]